MLRATRDGLPYANLSSSQSAPEASATYIYDQRNAQRAHLKAFSVLIESEPGFRSLC